MPLNPEGMSLLAYNIIIAPFQGSKTILKYILQSFHPFGIPKLSVKHNLNSELNSPAFQGSKTAL